MSPVASNRHAVVAVALTALALSTAVSAEPSSAARVDLLGDLRPSEGAYLVDVEDPAPGVAAYAQIATPARGADTFAIGDVDCQRGSSPLRARLDPVRVRDDRPFAIRDRRATARSRPPSSALAWASPVADSAVYGPSVRLAVAASRPARVEGIDFYVGMSMVASQRPGRRLAHFDSTAFADGEYQLTARAVLAGGGATTTSIPIAIDNAMASGAPGQTLFSSDFEDETFAGWYVQSLEERVRIASGGAAGSRWAARFEVHDEDEEPDTGDERSEISLPRPRFEEGRQLYFRDAIRVPPGAAIDRTYQIVHQLHEEDWDGSPGVAVFLERCPALTIGAGDGSVTFLDDAPIEIGRWHELVYRVKLSRNPAVGFMEVWLDGARQRLANGRMRMYGQTIQAARTYLKAGIYRGGSHSGTSVVEHDEIAVGTSLRAVTGR
ncbi:MAG TPA: heparin lyase I family protein [Thermoleophilaceae bacterium]|nr:heparin lyase I family protein [Thermoleophilaceae bacterium]